MLVRRKEKQGTLGAVWMKFLIGVGLIETLQGFFLIFKHSNRIKVKNKVDQGYLLSSYLFPKVPVSLTLDKL